MTPDKASGGPAQTAAATSKVTTTSNETSVTDIPVNVANDDASKHFAAGYKLGFETGVDIGHRRGVDAEADVWTSVLTGCTETWRQPRLAEITLARKLNHEPCRYSCGRCAQCFHADSWRRRGGRPYLGSDAERRMAGAA